MCRLYIIKHYSGTFPIYQGQHLPTSESFPRFNSEAPFAFIVISSNAVFFEFQCRHIFFMSHLTSAIKWMACSLQTRYPSIRCLIWRSDPGQGHPVGCWRTYFNPAIKQVVHLISFIKCGHSWSLKISIRFLSRRNEPWQPQWWRCTTSGGVGHCV